MKNYVIAEIGINHNGDLELAKELIMISKKSGCDAVKFQKRTIELVYTKEELDAYRESPWGTTNRQQKEGLEFSIDEYKELEKYCNSLEIDFIVSCWDINSLIEIEENCNVKYHKIASALLTDKKFLEEVNKTGKPVILSTGMSTMDEISKSISILENVEYILACTSTYPTPDEDVNLRFIDTLKKEFPNYKIGFSNHSSGLLACIGAVAFDTECIEFHITKDRSMYGSDQSSSIDHPQELLSSLRKMEKLLGDGNKNISEKETQVMKKLRKVNDILF
jgi:N-acetylneuraminate synthase